LVAGEGEVAVILWSHHYTNRLFQQQQVVGNKGFLVGNMLYRPKCVVGSRRKKYGRKRVISDKWSELVCLFRPNATVGFTPIMVGKSRLNLMIPTNYYRRKLSEIGLVPTTFFRQLTSLEIVFPTIYFQPTFWLEIVFPMIHF
jgi:hypothetical protein